MIPTSTLERLDAMCARSFYDVLGTHGWTLPTSVKFEVRQPLDRLYSILQMTWWIDVPDKGNGGKLVRMMQGMDLALDDYDPHGDNEMLFARARHAINVLSRNCMNTLILREAKPHYDRVIAMAVETERKAILNGSPWVLIKAAFHGIVRRIEAKIRSLAPVKPETEETEDDE